MNIHEVKREHLAAVPDSHYFDRKTLKFFGQTLRSFSTAKMSDGRTRISAPIIVHGRPCGSSVKFFNPANGKLENETVSA